MTPLNHWGITLVVVPIVSCVVTTLFFILRLYSRRIVRQKLDAGDILMSIGLVFSYGLTLCTVISAFHGVGHDFWSLSRPTRGTVTLLFWCSTKFWVLTHVFVKISYIVLLRKLFGAITYWRKLTTALIVITLAWGIAATLLSIFQCWPVQYFWIKHIEGTCMRGRNTFYIVSGSVALAENFVLVLVPLVVVWRMKLSPRQKGELSLLFGFGGLVCAVGFLRLITFKKYVTADATKNGYLQSIWSIIELDLGIICASVILMRPIFHRLANLIKNKCCAIRSQTSKSSCSSKRVQMMSPLSWPKPLSFAGTGSVDEWSQVRAEAYSTRVHGSVDETHSLAGIRDIMVEVSIDREMRAKEEMMV
ncbi:hypothetical protein AbraIFM66951_009302 [Aspergillus brasiliensis]|uniref:Rhodopsin domain-containing protein n=1 Tax=Aspergillus brasiliensis TaxID=319629 RepID=A0A9W5YSV8_9EURO|nr:hypothetical protein AbraCBS73388_009136 [Aspergillus brasiliensis]GKZ46369.1 hypothetical protein AbraIFM66951_009302 [Aspergillus brasiliensis]